MYFKLHIPGLLLAVMNGPVSDNVVGLCIVVANDTIGDMYVDCSAEVEVVCIVLSVDESD